MGIVVANFLVRGAEMVAGGRREERDDAVRRNGATEGQRGVVELRRVERKRRDIITKWEVLLIVYRRERKAWDIKYRAKSILWIRY